MGAGLADLTNLVLGGKSDKWVGEGPSDDPTQPGAEEEITTDPSPLEMDYSRVACLMWPVLQQQTRQVQALEAALLALVEQVKALEAGA